MSDSLRPTAAGQASLSIPNSWTLLKLMSIESVMPTNHLILCHPLLLQTSIFPSISVFSFSLFDLLFFFYFTLFYFTILYKFFTSGKYWSSSFSISPSNEYSGLIPFRIGWFDLLAVQGTLKSLLQSQFNGISSSALSFLYSPTLTTIHDYWKNHSLDYTDICWQSNVSAF